LDDVRIILSALWVPLMFTYLLVDVLLIYAGDFTAGELMGKKVTQGMLLGIAILMLLPIVMLFLSLKVTYPMVR